MTRHTAETNCITQLNYRIVCTPAGCETASTWENFEHQGTKLPLFSYELYVIHVSFSNVFKMSCNQKKMGRISRRDMKVFIAPYSVKRFLSAVYKNAGNKTNKYVFIRGECQCCHVDLIKLKLK